MNIPILCPMSGNNEFTNDPSLRPSHLGSQALWLAWTNNARQPLRGLKVTAGSCTLWSLICISSSSSERTQASWLFLDIDSDCFLDPTLQAATATGWVKETNQRLQQSSQLPAKPKRYSNPRLYFKMKHIVCIQKEVWQKLWCTQRVPEYKRCKNQPTEKTNAMRPLPQRLANLTKIWETPGKWGEDRNHHGYGVLWCQNR